MMEELRMLAQAIANLPDMAVWAMVVFYGYKVLIAGSIYGVIRYVFGRLTDVWRAGIEARQKTEEARIPKRVKISELCECSEEEAAEITIQLRRVRGEIGRFERGENDMYPALALQIAITQWIESRKTIGGGGSSSALPGFNWAQNNTSGAK